MKTFQGSVYEASALSGWKTLNIQPWVLQWQCRQCRKEAANDVNMVTGIAQGVNWVAYPG
jgi:hypothetical protein